MTASAASGLCRAFVDDVYLELDVHAVAEVDVRLVLADLLEVVREVELGALE